jgi:hypothetical protein
LKAAGVNKGTVNINVGLFIIKQTFGERCCLHIKDVSNISVKYVGIRVSEIMASCLMLPQPNSVRIYRGADKSLARPGRKQATATEDYGFHMWFL